MDSVQIVTNVSVGATIGSNVNSGALVDADSVSRIAHDVSINPVEIKSNMQAAATVDSNVSSGGVGPAGPPGANGLGVPSGGTTGQVLSKNSNADNDTEWADQTGGLGSISEDLTPSLGGNLDATDHAIDNVTQIFLDYIGGNTDNNVVLDFNGNFLGTLAVQGTAVVLETRTVNGHPLSSDVIVTKADVGLGSANDTSDANKPVSTAQAAADAAVASAAAAALAAHEADTTNIHGIANTAVLETTSGAQAKADAKVADAINDGTTTVAPSQNAVFDALALKQPLDSDLSAIAALTATTDSIIQSKGSAWTARTLAQYRADLNFESRTTFSNANYIVLATDRYVAQVGTMSAHRTVTLPAANSVIAGYTITIADESGTVGRITASSNYRLDIARSGADTIRNPNFPTRSTTDMIWSPYDSRTFRSDGTSKWVVVNPGSKRPIIWYSHANPVAIPSGVKTPLPWNRIYVDSSGANPAYTTTFTLHSSMNGVVLPTSSIRVNESISALPTSGHIVITGPPGTGVDTVIGYTGINTGTNTFTGCNSGQYVGISTGTLATNQVVTQAFVEVGFTTPYLYQVTAVITLTANPNGWRSLEVANYLLGTVIPFFTGTDTPAMNINNQHMTVTAQPPAELDGGQDQASIIRVYQNSGSVLQSTVNGLETSILFAFQASGE